MAIPIRLILGDGTTSIDLLSTGIDMNIKRNVSQYPTPGLTAGRVGIDTNVPEIKIDIQGILVDDMTVESGREHRSPLITAINFGEIIPERKGDESRLIQGAYQSADRIRHSTVSIGNYSVPATDLQVSALYGENAIKGKFTTTADFQEGSTTTINVKKEFLHYGNGTITNGVEGTVSYPNTFQDGWVLTGNRANGAVSSGASATVLVEPVSFILGTLTYGQDVTYRPTTVFQAGDRIVKSDGTFVGIVASATDSSLDADGVIETAADNKVVFTSTIATSLSDEDRLFKQFSLFNNRGQVVGLVESLFYTASSDTWDIGLASANAVALDKDDEVYVNMMLPIEEALDGQSIKITPSYWLEDVSRSPAGRNVDNYFHRHHSQREPQGIKFVFDAGVAYTTAPTVTSVIKKQTPYDSGSGIIKIPIKNLGDSANPLAVLLGQFTIAVNIGSSLIDQLSGVSVSEQFTFNPYLNLGSTNEGDKFLSFIVLELTGSILIFRQRYSPPTEVIMPNPLSSGLRNAGVEFLQTSNALGRGGPSSAGDKAQNLIGIVSNAHKDIDLIRGIQIPYDSLITSSAVTGITRNFFLTFGSIDADKKGSASNSIAASAPMLASGFSPQGGIGGVEVETKETLLSGIIDSFPEVASTILNFMVDNSIAAWSTLTTENQGNNNGISVMPNKLHVRYDAGNNYYAFNLELLASDYVIGV